MTNQRALTARAGLSPIILFVFLWALCLTAKAQTSSATDGSTPLGLQPGAPAGSYTLSGFDNVNLYNGSLNFQLPMLNIAGRGGAQIPVLLPIEGKWRVLDLAIPQADGSFNHHYMPVQSWWENNDRKYRPGSVVGRQGSFEVMTCPDNTTVYASTLTRLTFTAPDDTEYELRDQLTGGQVLGGASCNYLNPPSRGKVFVTSDGSSATFISDDTIYDYVISPNPAPEFFPSGYLLLRDGTRFRVQGGKVMWSRDRNGNKLTFGYDSNGIQTITDSINRVITITRNTGPGTFDQITYKGFGGAQRIVKVNYSALANALRSDFPTTFTYKSLFPELDGSTTTHHNPSVISSVTLPNNQEYQIRYNPYGEVARVVLPTGGAIEYDYADGGGQAASGAFAGGDEDSWVVYRRVVERRVYSNGGTGSTYESRMTYSRLESECAGCVKADQFNNSGTLLTRSKHYFYGSAAMSFGIGPTEYPGWKGGKEYQTEEFASDGTTLLRRIVNTWQQPTAAGTWPLTQAETSDAVKSNNPQITQTVTTLEPAQANKATKQTFGYDKYTNRTDVYEYDFGAGTAGALVRRSHTDYLTSSYDTLNPSGTSPDMSLTFHIRNLPTQASIFDAAGVERARSITEYDNYLLDGADCQHSFHCSLLARSNISGLDSSFTTSYTKRGNPTAVTRYLLSGGSGSISAYTQYDVAGNVVRVLDPRSTLSSNIATTIEYDDRFGAPNSEARSNTVPSELTGFTSFAFPTKVINALGHTSYAQFDYYLGQPVNGEDANGIVASGSFSDPLDRPNQIKRGIGTGAENQTTFAYDDVNRIVTSSNDRDTSGDNILVGKVLYDQMGRTTESRQYEGGSNFIATQTQYDALGRAFKSSNPFRPWQSESVVWTTQAFDALGRVTSETTPDNAVVTTSYSGNSVTVTDQAGKTRKSVTDALGRLTEVCEASDCTNYQTTYLYDTLDDLVKVTQGSQQRYFMYDSLKRLLRVRNPEQSTLASLNLSDPVTGNSAWSIGYQYDANSNLTQKTDPRGVVSNYVYDALNRNTTVDYSDTASINPDVKRFYDGATSGLGRFWYNYSGGDISTGANVDHTAIDSYDALGRPLVQRQLFKLNSVWSPTYQMTRTYNRAGAVKTQVYPSGHSITYNYDDAGRLADKDAQNLAFIGNLGDGVQRTYAAGITYSSWGTLGVEKFGTNTALYHKSFYNIRGQLFDTRLSSVNDTWDWNRGRLILYYSSNHLWGQSGTDNNGSLRYAETWIPPENATLDQADVLMEDAYDYDALNRLTSVTEQRMSVSSGWGVWQQQFKQAYSYDRYGNRTINAAQTWGTGINNKQFDVQTATNRLLMPVGQSGSMGYDAAGNLLSDTYSSYGGRVYDAENRMTAAQDSYAGWSYYTYDADGRRTRRKINSQETWQVYDFGGELLAEYVANAAAASPQKEYGYRNGELLVTAGVGTAPLSGLVGHWKLDENSGTTTADSSGTGNTGTLTSGAGWNTGQSGSAVSLDGVNDYVQVGSQSSLVMTSAVSLGAWIYPTGAGSEPTYGGTVVAKEGEYLIARFPNGKIQWAFANSNPGWTFFDTGYVAPVNQWTHIAVTYSSGTIKTYANGNLVHTYNGSGSIGDAITGQNDFRIGGRQITSQHFQGRIDDVRVYNRALAASEIGSIVSAGGGVSWLVTDHLGTPRMIADQTGSLANLKRHDYLPFGEELFAGAGGRTTGTGYSSGDGVRQQFTSKERDRETELDYFVARYYSSTQGRFTGPDSLISSAEIGNPQTWNRYGYVDNNPLRFVDPDGQMKKDKSGKLVFRPTTCGWRNHAGTTRQTSRTTARTTNFYGENGELETDDGTKIQAFKSRHVSVEAELAVASGRAIQTQTIDSTLQRNDNRMDTDCHGLSFTGGAYWIDNDQVMTLLQHDGYSPTDQTNPPQVGDIAIYLDGNNRVIHSATVTEVDGSGGVTLVAGIGGIQPAALNTPPQMQFPAARIQYWHKPNEPRAHARRRASLVRRFFKGLSRIFSAQ